MAFYANYNAADVAATARYILVDASDGTNFPHAANAAILPKSLDVQVDKEGTGDWVLRIGVVEEVDASNGSVSFFYIRQIRGISSLAEHISLGFTRKNGMNVNTIISVSDVDGSTNWQNDVTLANPTGSDTAPGAGDLVAELEEVDGTATVSFSITVEYEEA